MKLVYKSDFEDIDYCKNLLKNIEFEDLKDPSQEILDENYILYVITLIDNDRVIRGKDNIELYINTHKEIFNEM
jgi:hypothetical protein